MQPDKYLRLRGNPDPRRRGKREPVHAIKDVVRDTLKYGGTSGNASAGSTARLFNPPTEPPATMTFLALTDTPVGYAGSALMSVRVKATEDGLEFAAGGGTFIALSDTPGSWGATGQVAKINATTDALEWGYVDWTELTNVPGTFPPDAHTHVWADLTDPLWLLNTGGGVGGADFVYPTTPAWDMAIGGATAAASTWYFDSSASTWFWGDPAAAYPVYLSTNGPVALTVFWTGHGFGVVGDRTNNPGGNIDFASLHLTGTTPTNTWTDHRAFYHNWEQSFTDNAAHVINSTASGGWGAHTAFLQYSVSGASTQLVYNSHQAFNSFIKHWYSGGASEANLLRLTTPSAGLAHYRATKYDSVYFNPSQSVWDVEYDGVTRNNFCYLTVPVVTTGAPPARDQWMFTFTNNTSSPDVYNAIGCVGITITAYSNFLKRNVYIDVMPTYDFGFFSNTTVGGYVHYHLIDAGTGNEPAAVGFRHHYVNISALVSDYSILDIVLPMVSVLVRRSQEPATMF